MDAVIYTRVSSKKQLSEGHGNDAQEHVCKKFAGDKEYRLLNVFNEPGISGAKTERPAMQELVAFLRKRKGKKTAVIVDDLKRFSRDVGGYWELKQLIGDCGAHLMSPKHEFSDTPEGRFIETMLVASGQLEREQNARQVKERMKARMETGYWPFPAVPGYEIVKEDAHGKVMRRKEPEASIIVEALEGYASGRFEGQADVQRFIRRIYDKPTVQTARRLLDRALLYAGYLEYQRWDVNVVKGKHDVLISYETYKKIQDRMDVSNHVRKYDRPEFPLRGYVDCNCGQRMTASHSRGNGGSYAYYFCYNRKCPYYGKAIPAKKLESDFENLLKKIKPTKKMLALSKANLEKRWDERLRNMDAMQERLKRKYENTDVQVDRLALRAANTGSTVAANAYEKKIGELEKEKVNIREEMKKYVTEQLDFRTALEQVTEYLSNPLRRWNKGDLAARRGLIKMCFKDNVVYEREKGFRTNDLSLTYAVISGRRAFSEVAQSDSGHGGS